MNFLINKNRAFTMVEMLAVISVMAVIVALTIPNGIFARAAGEEAVARSQGANLELAMANYLARSGNAAQAKWDEAFNAAPTLPNMFLALQQVGAFPASASVQSVQGSLQGYTVTFPPKLSGKITITRSSDGQLIYPTPTTN